MDDKYLCPVCGKYELTFDTSEDCPVCGWLDDRVQLNNPDRPGENWVTLNRARELYKKYGTTLSSRIPEAEQ